MGNRGKGHLFQGNGGANATFLGEQGTNTILGNREHKQSNFHFFWNRTTHQFISGEQENRYPLPLVGPHGSSPARELVILYSYQVLHCLRTEVFLNLNKNDKYRPTTIKLKMDSSN